MMINRSKLVKILLILACGLVAGGSVTCDLNDFGVNFTRFDYDDDDEVIIVDDYYYDPFFPCCY